MDTSLSGSSFNSRLTHAQSTPAGVDGSGIFTLKTPPTTPKKNGKMVAVRVQMLDESITIFQVQAKAVGRLLFDQVCKQLNLLEADYFGLEYQDATTKYWLDFEKPMHRQIGLSLVDPFLKFCVKFYTPDPAQLEEEYTRYLFCLQIKRDLMQGDLQCNDNTAALIISYIVQAECGDYSSEDYPDHTYLSSLKFVSYQDKELERKIMENHKKHVGQSPAEADLNLLETARRCELYGMKMHPAKDQEGVPLNLAVAHMGIVVFQNSTKINTFSWAKIRKISFKRKRFLIKLHPEGYGYYKDIVEFVFDNRNQCKSFWKKCVENHGFFRCSYVKCLPRQKARVLSRGSSFRYSGKTQKQMVEYVRENYVKRQNFQRSQSFRHQSSLHSSVVNVGASISAHPLLPLGENAVAGSGASLSCESMTFTGSQSPTTLRDGGPQTAPTVMNQLQQPEHPHTQQQQSHQMQVDLHEPATTSSDITSIASQSPPFDTGLNRRYPNIHSSRVNYARYNNTVRSHHSNTNKTNKVEPPVSVKGACDRGTRALNHNHGVDSRRKLSAESGLKDFAQKSANVNSCSRSNVNDPDLLRDLRQSEQDEEFSWQRSASCKELSAVQKQERLQSKCGADRDAEKSVKTAVNKFDSYRHCYSCYGQPPLFDISNRAKQSSDTKIYSSSYPGTIASISAESKNVTAPAISAGTSPGVITVYADDAANDYNNDYEEIDRNDYQKLSTDDLSHDSYEIIERDSIFCSRSSSVNSDEMFVMDNDYKSVSKHILWREGSADVEKRLGYVEPRYRNVDFNQFNEICKRGFALRNRDASRSHGNIKFSEFSIRSEENAPEYPLYAVVNKKRPANVITHESVSRTKSDPHMTSEHKLMNRQKLFGVHQKSFDMAVPSYADTLYDDGYALSKSSADIPYTLRIRHQMNGTARDSTHNSGCSLSNNGISVHQNSTLVNDNAVGNGIDLKHVMLTKNSYEEVVTTKKSTKLMLSLSEENNESTTVATKEQPTPDQNKEEEKDDRRGTKRSSVDDGSKREHEQSKDKQHIVKVKSVETPKKSHSTRVRKSKSAETYDHRGSFLHADSSGSRGKKEIIVIDSDDYHSFDDSRSDKRSDGSDSVLIVEYRGNKKKKLSKKASSDSRGSQAESEASSFDAPRVKKKDLRKRHTGQTYFYKDRIPTIEISEDETYKADNNDNTAGLRLLNDYEYSSDERPASGSDLSKTDVVNELVPDDNSFLGDALGHTESITDNDEVDKDLPLEEQTAGKMKDENLKTSKNGESMECDIRGDPRAVPIDNFDSKNDVSAEKNRILEVMAALSEKSQIFSRLGLSEGSAIVSGDRSPQNSRRTKSLDTPIVSLHRLPPITSFSSKDDTVDSEEGVILEEKSLIKQKKSKNASEAEEMVITSPTTNCEVSVAKKIKSAVLAGEKPEIKPKPDLSSVVNRLMSNPTAVSIFRKQSLDAATSKADVSKTPLESDPLNKERSKSEGYDRNLSKLTDSFLQTLERKHSTRQERLDSFRKLKNFSIELWDNEDGESNRKKVIENKTSEEYGDDNVFEEVDALVPGVPSKKGDIVEESSATTPLQSALIDSEQTVPTAFSPKDPMPAETEKEQETTRNVQNVPILELSASSCEKRSFDEEQSSLSSIPAEPVKYPLESSGSSSVDEVILPPDYVDEEDLPALPPMYMSLDMVKGSNLFGVKSLSTSLTTSFNAGFFSLSRTLSRISERSTEQERTDMDDDPTKPLSRSLSIDDSILSSDQHVSFSSDPPSGMNLENVFDDDDILPPIELDDQKFDFSIPPPLLNTEDEEWPSPPHSPSSISTPVVADEYYSSARTLLPEPDSQQEEDDGGSISEDNKTLQDGNEDTSNDQDNNEKPRHERLRESLGDDTSLGLTTSDLSSSTGNTVKHAHAGTSCANKSEDNSLAGDFAVSLSTDVASESRKSSIDDTHMSYEKKYLTLDRKQTSMDRKFIFFPSKFPSLEDEYDSPYTESDDSPSSPFPPIVLRKQLPPSPPQAQDQRQPSPQKLPLPPRHYQDAAQSTMQKIRSRVERNRAAKFTSSSMSTSLESPTNAERKFAKAVAKAKCHSFFSLARSPPSGGSSSSAEAPDTPLTPNTIPRVSKRRRQTHASRRRSHRPVGDLLHKSPSSTSHGQSNAKPSNYFGRKVDHTNGRAERSQTVIAEETTRKPFTPPLNNGIVNGNQIIVEVETNMPAYKTNGMLPNSYTTKFLSKDEVSIESPMPELRNMARIHHAEELNSDTGTKRKRPSDKAYYIAKELLVTERTYRKDLEVICFWLRDDFTKEDADIHIFEAIDRLLLLIDPIYDAHCVLLRELETRLSCWEPPYISDILNNFFENLQVYERYLEEHVSVLCEINSLFVSNPRFETLYREFESQKVCYLPVTTFILKPLQRLVHYSQILERLLKYYGKNHPHYEDCYQARTVLVNIANFVPKILRKSENLVLLHELNRDITGFENLLLPDREFIRQGCLSKFSQRKGYQQRMFFLFSDIILYSNRLQHAFRIHGQLPLNNVMIEERPDTPQQHSFSIYGGNRVITVAANSEEEKEKWLEDLTEAIQKCKTNYKQRNGIDPNSLYYFSLKSCNSSDDIAEKYDDSHGRTLSVVNQRSNNTVYVCWHRNTTISIEDHLKAVENQLSGFLLRKFKNSNGWQKLWVVFTNFCLFFYKSFQEDCPLASLPLLGYSITTPSEKDAIQKDFVFKLQFKNHVYFFRAESEYTFNRWMEVIGNATQNYGRKDIAQSNIEIN